MANEVDVQIKKFLDKAKAVYSNEDYMAIDIACRFGREAHRGQKRVSGEELASFPLLLPSDTDLKAFEKVGSMALEQMKQYSEEISLLKQLQETITATLSSR